jgi:hypothetical protein
MAVTAFDEILSTPVLQRRPAIRMSAMKPFLLALVTWEVHAERRPPVLSMAATLLCWLTLVSLTTKAHPDVQALAYLAWSVPMAVYLSAHLLGVGRPSVAPSVAPRPAI